MSLNALVRLPLSSSGVGRTQLDETMMGRCARPQRHLQKRRLALVVEAKGKKAVSRQFQRQAPPPLPKIEDDGNPRFVIFIRTSNIYLWYPLSVVTGGTTAKIMVAAKDSFLGKYIYKDTIARNLAAVIYRDEKSLQTTAFKQFRVLRSATSFRYGYKLVENNNLRAALSTSDVIELPKEEELKTVLDKVKDFFGDAGKNAKESFGKITSISSETDGSDLNTESKS